MHKTLTAIILAFPLFTSTAFSAEFNMRPGLWQITTTSDLLWLAQQVPPEQMQNLKDLADEYGLEMPKIQNGAAISNTCITQEMASQKTLPDLYQSQLGCASKNATRHANNYKMEFVCSGAELKGNGTATGTITSPETFSGQTKFDGSVQGNPVQEQADIKGQWMSASCAAAKPAQ